MLHFLFSNRLSLADAMAIIFMSSLIESHGWFAWLVAIIMWSIFAAMVRTHLDENKS